MVAMGKQSSVRSVAVTNGSDTVIAVSSLRRTRIEFDCTSASVAAVLPRALTVISDGVALVVGKTTRVYDRETHGDVVGQTWHAFTNNNGVFVTVTETEPLDG